MDWLHQYKQRMKAESYLTEDETIVEDALISLKLNKNILLKGPTGSGKTKLAHTIANVTEHEMISVNCSVDLDAEALLGFKTIELVDGQPTIRFIDGPVVEAMKRGALLYIDEINMAKPETLPILNGVLDYRRTITNPFTNEVIEAKAGFAVIAAINEGYVGTVPLNEALKNRFITIEVPYVQGEALFEIIRAQSQLTDEATIRTFVQLSNDMIAQVKEGIISEEAASIRALLDACDLALYIPAKRAVYRAIVEKLEDERERQAIVNIAETLFE